MIDLEAIAREEILDFAREADMLTILEGHDVTDEEAEKVLDLIKTAKIAISWSD